MLSHSLSSRHNVTGVVAASLLCLAACGSDKKTTTSTTATATDSNTTQAADTSVVNSDKTGTEPQTQPTSPAVKSTLSGVDKPMPYVLFSSNANATTPSKSYSVTAYSYDTCVFSWNHGYKVFPSGKFDFVGFYLVNETPGAPLAVGTYTAGATTGMYIDTQNSGAGYDITSCKAASYPTVASGTVVITALGTGTAGTTGTLNVTMSDGSVFTGDFETASCKGGTATTQPTAPATDPYACTSIH